MSARADYACLPSAQLLPNPYLRLSQAQCHMCRGTHIYTAPLFHPAGASHCGCAGLASSIVTAYASPTLQRAFAVVHYHPPSVIKRQWQAVFFCRKRKEQALPQ